MENAAADRIGSRPRPALRFSGLSLRSLVSELCTRQTLLVTDDYNYPAIRDLGRTIAVEDTDAGRIEEVRKSGGYSDVVAIGGCTALDFGRACAMGMRLAAVPTILSNCCISSDRSVIRRNNHYSSEATTAPQVTAISLPTIEENHADPRKNWSASGLGDLFSTFASVAEANWELAILPGQQNNIFAKQAPICMETLNWISSATYPLERSGLEHLARVLHEFSIVGHDSVPIGSEHGLYYALRIQRNYPRMVATHGKLVSIGTLITLRLWSETSGDFSMYNALRLAFAKIGLPVTLEDLKNIGVEPEHILSACDEARDTIYGRQFSGGDTLLLDRAFDSKH